MGGVEVRTAATQPGAALAQSYPFPALKDAVEIVEAKDAAAQNGRLSHGVLEYTGCGIEGLFDATRCCTVWPCPPHGWRTARTEGNICGDEPHVSQGCGAWRLGVFTLP
jgi:hypothetical protein